MIRKYPWDEWLQPGRPTTLKVGLDFQCSRASMMQQVRNAARAAGLRVAKLRDNHVILSFMVTRRSTS